MTLAEKIAALRGEQKLSQGDLAEKLDVSRQSVSKWETAQAVPELDKIIKLADLFGVTVDELVRDGETPEPRPGAEPKIVYIERPRQQLTRTQALGVVLIVGGLVLMLAGLLNGVFLLFGGALTILGLPLLLVKKHPFLIDGWLLAAAAYPLGVCSGLTPSRLLRGFEWISCYFTETGPGRCAVLLGGVLAAARGILTLALAGYTAWLCWKWWKKCKPPALESDG